MPDTLQQTKHPRIHILTINVGRGSKPKAGLCGFSVSDLLIPDFTQPWEIDVGVSLETLLVENDSISIPRVLRLV